jgi:metallo-beta-lactamase family protein
MTISVCSHGAAEEVTGSKHLVEVDGRRLLLDCGMFQGRRQETREKNENLPFAADGVESVVLSHGHFDHCGAIPILVKNGFQGNIFSTPATREIASLVMMDSAHLQAMDAKWMEKKRARKKDPDPATPLTPLYHEADVVDSLSHFITVAYHRTYSVMDGVRATFFDAGHILGSCLTRLEIEGKGKRLVLGFSGDLGREKLPIIRDPELFPPLDYLILESTYGNRKHDPMTTAMDELAQVVNQVFANRGKLIIPAFAVERSQELVFFLHLLHDRGQIPDIPIYVDSPMAVNATSIFRTHPECYDEETRRAFLDHHENPFGFETLHFVTSTEESKRLNNLDQPAVIISSSGMCEGGRILHHLANSVSDPKNVILIVGFMAQNTLGRKLADKEREVKIFGERYPVKARVKIINAFSAHADYTEIQAWLKKLDRGRLKAVFLVHGEPEAQANLQKVLLADGLPRVEILRRGQPVELE